MAARPLAAIAALAALQATAAWANCAAPIGRDFPQSTLAAANVNPASLATMNDALDAASMEVRALVVIRDCKLAFERYGSGLGRDSVHVIHSVTKSITTTIGGHLLMKGAIPSLDSSIASLVAKPGPATAEMWANADRITLRHALGMASGLEYRHSPRAIRSIAWRTTGCSRRSSRRWCRLRAPGSTTPTATPRSMVRRSPRRARLTCCRSLARSSSRR
jgi:CubicO group peptidase (beta-lactamase class C family)